MECHEVQQLLAFMDRKNSELDATEGEAIQQHLDRCPACSEDVQAERRLDEMVGVVLRDVPVPADLRQKVMNRLTPAAGGVPWKGLAAAGLLLALTLAGGLTWYSRTHPAVHSGDLENFLIAGNLEADDVERTLAERGFAVKMPREFFDFRYFQDASVVDFKGRRVAKVTFARFSDDGHPPAIASVLILPKGQFRLDADLKDGKIIPASTAIRIHHEGDFVHVIYYRGELSRLGNVPAN